MAMASTAVSSLPPLQPWHRHRLAALPSPAPCLRHRGSSSPHGPPPLLRSITNPQGMGLHHSRRVLCCHSLREEPAAQEAESDPHPERGPAANQGDGAMMNLYSKAFFFVLWFSLTLYALVYSPNQTPFRDQYFVKKLMGFEGDDGFLMNQVLVCVWYIMGLWPLIYTMLLIPTGRSSNGRIAVWPFVTLSFFVGMFGFLPYCGLWEPPPPSISRVEVDHWPLKAFESKILAVVVAVAGTSLAAIALLAGSNSWNEFLQYFKESKLIHITSLDFLGLSLLAPFWVYNDITVRQRSNRISWLTLLSVVPFLGPAWYLVFRNSLPATIFKDTS